MTRSDSEVREKQAELLRVLGHPMRLTILSLLGEGERSVGDLAECTGFGLSALSQQLAILRKAMLVTARREAKQVFYKSEPDTVRKAAAIIAALDRQQPTAAQPVPLTGQAVDTRLGAAMFARVTRPVRQDR